MKPMRWFRTATLYCVTTLGVWAQDKPDAEELALRSDPEWTQLVVVLRDGKRVTYSRSEIVKIEYVTPRSSSAPGSAIGGGNVIARLTSGKALGCEARAGGKVYPCSVRVTSHDKSTGGIVGELTWTSLASVHRIRGKLSGNQLSFTETEAIRKGGAHLNVEYTLTISGGTAKGSWVDRGDNNARGTFSINNL